MVSSRRRRLGEQTFGGLVLWLVVASVLFVACSGKTTQAGGLELLLETDLPTPATFDTVNVKLEQQAAESTWRLFHQRNYVIPNEMTLPTTIALMAGQSPYENVRITVTGLAGKPEQPIVQRVVQTQVPSDRIDEVLLVLSSRCVGKLACPRAGDSCQPDLAVCGPNTTAALRPYNPADLSDAGVASKVGAGVVGAGDGGPKDATVDMADARGADATDLGCNTDPACTGAATAGPTCTGTATIATCAQDGHGCWYASTPSPCTNGACFGSAGSAQCCANACSNGSKQCGGAGIETCQVQGNGCTAWNAGAACVGHQHCTGPAGSATCVCNADPTCSKGGTVCANATTSATCSQDGQGCFYTASTTACMANQTCSGGACSCSSGFTRCPRSCVNVNNDNSNCGSCGHACPVLASPASGATCTSTTCQGNLGGFVSAGGPVSLDSSSQTSYFVSATMPSTSGTFVGVGATVGSQDTSGSTPFILGLYADSGGAPGNLLFYTDQSPSVPNPSSPVALTSMSYGGSYTNGFTGALTANTTYWVYLHPGTGASTMATAALSSSPCVAAMWINVMPPTMGSYATATSCPGNLDLYLVATFP